MCDQSVISYPSPRRGYVTIVTKNRLSTIYVLNLIIIVASLHPVRSCSSFCTCDTWYGLQRASCTGRHLYSIHTGASSNVEALDLHNNSISTLNNYELAHDGFTRIKYLNLSENSINEIGLYAFAGLTNLSVLDLSKNHLYYILTSVFVENQNLRVLRLSRNNFNVHVPKLQCPSLTELNMDSCLISHLPLDTFEGLGQLRSLDISNNMMIQLDTLVIQTLPLLRKLSLEGNPWSCNENMFLLEKYLDQKNILFDLVCNKRSEPKKFEKMIVLKSPTTYHRRVSTSSKKTQKTNTVPKNNSHNTQNQNKSTTCVEMTNTQVNVTSTTNQTSPYLFIIIGFLFGSGTSMLFSYIWLTRCRRRDRYYSRRDRNDPQRISLLQDQWQMEESISRNETNERISCPGTPPPPYREVVLHPSLYRSASSITNLRI